MNRKLVSVNSNEIEAYSEEELTAEIGSAFLCELTKIENSTTQTDHKAYIQGWIKSLQDHPQAIVYASTRAEKAVDYLTK